jgi:hypothetical protein
MQAFLTAGKIKTRTAVKGDFIIYFSLNRSTGFYMILKIFMLTKA